MVNFFWSFAAMRRLAAISELRLIWRFQLLELVGTSITIILAIRGFPSILVWLSGFLYSHVSIAPWLYRDFNHQGTFFGTSHPDNWGLPVFVPIAGAAEKNDAMLNQTSSLMVAWASRNARWNQLILLFFSILVMLPLWCHKSNFLFLWLWKLPPVRCSKYPSR